MKSISHFISSNISSKSRNTDPLWLISYLARLAKNIAFCPNLYPTLLEPLLFKFGISVPLDKYVSFSLSPLSKALYKKGQKAEPVW